MPEINDVQIGETIAVEWGNAIRDRTIQRYANAAERDELHPNPTEGDLSYLADTNSVEIYDGVSWVAPISSFERSAATVETSVPVPDIVDTLVIATLNIPTSWSSWKCVAFAHAVARPLSVNPGDIGLHVQIDGVDGPEFRYNVSGAPVTVAVTAASSRSDITTTGNRTIRLQGRRYATPDVVLPTVFLYARAFRTS